jgi:hypothetical protein
VLSCSEAGRESKLTSRVVEGVVSKQGTSGIVEKGSDTDKKVGD